MTGERNLAAEYAWLRGPMDDEKRARWAAELERLFPPGSNPAGPFKFACDVADALVSADRGSQSAREGGQADS